MKFALMDEILAAHHASDHEHVDALLTRFLQDISLIELPDELLDRLVSLLEGEAAAVPADVVDRALARLGGGTAPAVSPCLFDCLKRGLEDADDLGELGLDAIALAKIQRDRRPITQTPQTLRDFCAWLAEGGIELPPTSQQRLLKVMRKGLPQLRPGAKRPARSFQAARKETRTP